jgi:hypothetical protein
MKIPLPVRTLRFARSSVTTRRRMAALRVSIQRRKTRRAGQNLIDTQLFVPLTKKCHQTGC